ncbi:MAG: hypothetical protein AUK03_09980 [Anaerolineae bacterium CG2_30_64_16]|nr:MAG: hypothetical protein AUK03_09980 [Anaerolineae bacterium CG2_30_64_16]
MLVMAASVTIGLRSVLGLAITFLAFLPTALYRAALEEQALAARYGPAWAAYRQRTHSMVPFVY